MNETSYFHDIPGLGHVFSRCCIGWVRSRIRPVGAVRLAAGLNAVVHARPPLGVAGLQGSDRNGKFIFGALGIGALKLKLHRTWCGWRPRFQRHDCR
jgi:hypothetical protein